MRRRIAVVERSLIDHAQSRQSIGWVTAAVFPVLNIHATVLRGAHRGRSCIQGVRPRLCIGPSNNVGTRRTIYGYQRRSAWALTSNKFAAKLMPPCPQLRCMKSENGATTTATRRTTVGHRRVSNQSCVSTATYGKQIYWCINQPEVIVASVIAVRESQTVGGRPRQQQNLCINRQHNKTRPVLKNAKSVQHQLVDLSHHHPTTPAFIRLRGRFGVQRCQ